MRTQASGAIVFRLLSRRDHPPHPHPMTTPNLNWIANYIWGIADDVLRDVYVRGKYRDVILPMTVLRRLDAVLEPTKQAVLDMKAWLDEQGIVEQKETLRQAAGQAFYNTSKFTLHDLRARASRQQLRADFEDYLDGFSPGVQDILENFEFRHQIPRLSKADALGSLIADSGGCRSVIPFHADRRYHGMPIGESAMPITDSGACRSPWSERVGALENLL